MIKVMVGKSAAIIIVVISFLSFPVDGKAEFPDHPIQILCAWGVGALNDMVDRAVAQALQRTLKQPVIVQNVPGGGGALALGRIKTVKPDGYTIFQTGSPQYFRIPHMRSVPYDPLKDFAYLAQDSCFQECIEVRADSQWKTFDELLDFVKKNPKKVRYGSPGVGTSEHVVMEYLGMRENLQWIHIPFNSSVEIIAALMGGHIEVYSSSSIGIELEQIRAGKIRVLLSTYFKRNPVFPDVPSILEKGYDFSIAAGRTWSVPAQTPKDIQRKLETALLQSFKDTPVQEAMNVWHLAFDPLGSEALTKLITKEYQSNGELLKKIGIYKKE